MENEYPKRHGEMADADESKERFGWHKGTEVTGPLHQVVRAKFAELDMFLQEALPQGRAKSLARTELETSGMWANKAVAELAPVVEG
jgi:hypothetical protein